MGVLAIIVMSSRETDYDTGARPSHDGHRSDQGDVGAVRVQTGRASRRRRSLVSAGSCAWRWTGSHGHGGDRYPLSPLPGARWFSEAWLPSAFQARFRGDPLAESRTHADAVLGHFAIGDPGTSGLALAPDARQFSLLEAKLTNRLSSRRQERPGLRSGGAIGGVHGRGPSPGRPRAVGPGRPVVPDPRPPRPDRRRRFQPETPTPPPSSARPESEPNLTAATATPGSATGSSPPSPGSTSAAWPGRK